MTLMKMNIRWEKEKEKKRLRIGAKFIKHRIIIKINKKRQRTRSEKLFHVILQVNIVINLVITGKYLLQ